jgi:hypothetical protein
MPAAHAEKRNMVFPEQRDAGAWYRHEKFKPSHNSAIDDFPSAARVAGRYIEAVRRMAATRTRDTFGTCRSKIAIDPCAAPVGGRRKCGRLGGTAMITISIFWALVIALFTTKGEQPLLRKRRQSDLFREM